MKREETQNQGGVNETGINSVDREGWANIEVVVDSGAVDMVGPPSIVKHIETKENARSKACFQYVAANGATVSHYGEKDLKGETDTGDRVNMVMQVAGVMKVLASVSRMTRANNRVVFYSEGSYILNKTTNKRTPLKENNGVYVVNVWVKRKEEWPQQGFTRQESRWI